MSSVYKVVDKGPGLRAFCARAVQMAPVDAPMIAAGLPSQALSPWGREAQSIAFFNTPSIVFRRNK